MKMHLSHSFEAYELPQPLRLMKMMFDHLPFILLADIALCMAALPAVLAWIGGMPVLTLWLAVIMVAPVWAWTSTASNTLLRGQSVRWRVSLPVMLRGWYAAVRIGCIPALIATIFIVTWRIIGLYHQAMWLYLPLFIDGCIATLVLLASLSAFSLAASHFLRGWRLWKTALAISRLQLGKLFAILIIFLILAWLCLVFNASLISLLGAPLAFCLASVTQQTCTSLQNQAKDVEDLWTENGGA